MKMNKQQKIEKLLKPIIKFYEGQENNEKLLQHDNKNNKYIFYIQDGQNKIFKSFEFDMLLNSYLFWPKSLNDVIEINAEEAYDFSKIITNIYQNSPQNNGYAILPKTFEKIENQFVESANEVLIEYESNSGMFLRTKIAYSVNYNQPLNISGIKEKIVDKNFFESNFKSNNESFIDVEKEKSNISEMNRMFFKLSGKEKILDNMISQNELLDNPNMDKKIAELQKEVDEINEEISKLHSDYEECKVGDIKINDIKKYDITKYVCGSEYRYVLNHEINSKKQILLTFVIFEKQEQKFFLFRYFYN